VRDARPTVVQIDTVVSVVPPGAFFLHLVTDATRNNSPSGNHIE
jgi:hypothetical protein